MGMHNILHEFEFRPDTTTDNEAIYIYSQLHLHFLSVAFNPIFYKLESYKDMLRILVEFEFQPNPTTCYRLGCP